MEVKPVYANPVLRAHRLGAFWAWFARGMESHQCVKGHGNSYRPDSEPERARIGALKQVYASLKIQHEPKGTETKKPWA
jgi:hypothetical protein